MRQLAAWERDGKWYLSAFIGARVHANGKVPAKEFDSRAELDAYAAKLTDAKRRKPELIIEHEADA